MGNENSSARLRSKIRRHALHAGYLCLKHSFFHLQEEKQYEMCFCHFPGNLLHCLFSGRQVCIFPAAWDPGRGERAHVTEQRLLIKPVCARIELKCCYDEIPEIPLFDTFVNNGSFLYILPNFNLLRTLEHAVFKYYL